MDGIERPVVYAVALLNSVHETSGEFIIDPINSVGAFFCGNPADDKWLIFRWNLLSWTINNLYETLGCWTSHITEILLFQLKV